MSVSTHVLDAARGRPAAAVSVSLHRRQGDGWHELARSVTDADGRCPDLGDGLELGPAVYQLRFATGDYFAATGTPTFYPVVEITFAIVDADAHHHVPLLLSPYAYSTYRGS